MFINHLPQNSLPRTNKLTTALIQTFTTLGKTHFQCQYLVVPYTHLGGPGSSVSIATDYGLGSLGLNPGGEKIFCLSRLALGPTQPPA